MLPIPSSTRRPAGRAQRAKRPSAHSAAGDAIELVVIEPKRLRTTTNLRAELTLTPGFTDSIRQNGVLEAITARRDAAGDLGIQRGYRRAATAVEAGLPAVPLLVEIGQDKVRLLKPAGASPSAVGAHYGSGQRSRRAAACP